MLGLLGALGRRLGLLLLRWLLGRTLGLLLAGYWQIRDDHTGGTHALQLFQHGCALAVDLGCLRDFLLLLTGSFLLFFFSLPLKLCQALFFLLLALFFFLLALPLLFGLSLSLNLSLHLRQHCCGGLLGGDLRWGSLSFRRHRLQKRLFSGFDVLGYRGS